MIPVVKAKLLEGKKGLIVGIANENSIAWGCAKAFRAFGAELAVTYLNDKAKKYVEFCHRRWDPNAQIDEHACLEFPGDAPRDDDLRFHRYAHEFVTR
jgi:enoyl-[acyl-carrier-protein] reductase (NADH)